MSENIKDALEYAVDLAENSVQILQDKNGNEYYNSSASHLKQLLPEKFYPASLYLNTLSSLVDYIKSGLNDLLNQKLIVVVEDACNVNVYTEDDDRKKRSMLANVEAMSPQYNYERYLSTENFNIEMQSKYIDSHDREVILKFASRLKIENGAQIEDDGVSQTTTIKNGVASLAKGIVPNPVTLQPRRTFLEVEQPASQFVFRVNSKGELALFEADGGAWKIEAKQNIAIYLKQAFEKLDNITVLA